MQLGNYKHRVTIERPQKTQDPQGNFAEVWQPVQGFVRIQAEVLPERAGEFFSAKQPQSTVNALVKLRYQPGIEPTMRLVHHVRPGMDEYYDIQGVFNVRSAQEETRLMCLRRDAEGWRRGVDLVN